jgi:hypothetical protein
VVGFVNSELGYWTLALAVLSVILGGTRMIWEQRGAPLKDLLRSLLTLTLVSGRAGGDFHSGDRGRRVLGLDH